MPGQPLLVNRVHNFKRRLTGRAVWHAQVAGDSNVAGQVYPDQSLYPVNSVPTLVERINNALQRADQIEHAEGHVTVSHRLLTRSPACCGA